MVTPCTQLHIQMILFLLFLYHSPLSNALESVESITIQIRDDVSAETGNPTVYATLWFNNAIYQLQMRRPQRNMQYVFSSADFTILGPSDCANIADTKIMIENDVTNAVFIDSFKFTTNTGAWYGIEAICADSALAQWYANSQRNHWLLDQPLCDSGYALLGICVDNEMSVCGPSKQIFYFDTSKPNEFITYSQYESDANTVPQLESCAPSKQPTDSPTTSPITTAPTASPITSSQPTQSPTLSPTKRPSTSSISATMQPTDEIVATLSKTTATDALSPRHDTADRNEFVIDEAAIIWIVVCSALCFIIVIVFVIAAVFKNVAKSNEENGANAQQNDTNGNTTDTTNLMMEMKHKLKNGQNIVPVMDVVEVENEVDAMDDGVYRQKTLQNGEGVNVHHVNAVVFVEDAANDAIVVGDDEITLDVDPFYTDDDDEVLIGMNVTAS